ncbi:carbohydrate ABC transporter permease [Candidatus Bipolaricaulota bacterium]|nr:carbohydrate ABC transporter permease [Candidatus Bipolaricaulota bacterium]
MNRKKERRYVAPSTWTRIVRRASRGVPYILLALSSLPILSMYLWLLMSSLSSKVLFGFIPAEFTARNWRFLWEPIQMGAAAHLSVWKATWNTLIFAVSVMLIVVLVATLAGFALSRMQFRGRESIMRLIILLHAFPGITLLIAIFYVLYFLTRATHIKFLDSLWGVALVKASLEIPWSAWIIKGFFDNIPWEVEWSAYIDGCNRFQAWYKVILPQLKPGIAAISIFSFLAGWGEFIYLYTFIFSEQNQTLSLLIKALIGEFRFTDYGLLAAVSLFYIVPVLIFFIFTQKGLMRVTVGGIKGGR